MMGQASFCGEHMGVKRKAHLVPLFLEMSDHIFHDACTLLGLCLFAAGGERGWVTGETRTGENRWACDSRSYFSGSFC